MWKILLRQQLMNRGRACHVPACSDPPRAATGRSDDARLEVNTQSKLVGPESGAATAMRRAQLRLPVSVAAHIAGLASTACRARLRHARLHPLTLRTAQVRYGGSDADNDSAFQRCHASRYSCAGGQRPQAQHVLRRTPPGGRHGASHRQQHLLLAGESTASARDDSTICTGASLKASGVAATLGRVLYVPVCNQCAIWTLSTMSTPRPIKNTVSDASRKSR